MYVIREFEGRSVTLGTTEAHEDFDFPSLFPSSMMDDRLLYCRAMHVRVHGTVTKTGGGFAQLERIVSNMRLTSSHERVRLVDNISGNRLFRANRAGHQPEPLFVAPAGWGENLEAGVNSVDFELVHYFASAGRKRSKDTHLPLPMLRHANLRLEYGSLANVGAADGDVTAGSLTVRVWFELVPRPEKALAFEVLTKKELTAGQTEIPAISVPGKIVDLCIGPQSDGLMPAAADFARLGVTVGGRVLRPENALVQPLYDAWNRDKVAAERMARHVDTRTDYRQVIPVTVGNEPDGRRITDDAFPSGAPVVLRPDAATNAHVAIIRFRYDEDSSVFAQIEADLGISRKKRVTASHKPPKPAESQGLPVKEVK